MTRKDYVMLQTVLRTQRDAIRASDLDVTQRCAAYDTHSESARAIADGLAQYNPRFDRERFLKAAGVMERTP